MSRKLFVTGASGQLGRRVLELLLEANEGTIIAGTRRPEKLADFAEQGVIVRYANFDEPESLKEAFEGVDRLLLISTDVVGEGNKRLNQHLNAVKAANEAGVSHVVYTSLISADTSPVLFAPDHSGTEEALADSSMGWTILRNNIYMDMLLQTLSQAYQMGGLYNAVGDGKVAYISREDCARAAAAALAASFDGKRILDITGPEAVSQTELASIASELTGQTLNYVPVALEAVIDGMVGAGLPRFLAETYASFDTANAQGKSALVSKDFEELTGAEAMRVIDFLKAHQAALIAVATQ